jgi:N-acetylneuraminic acid mutarotase
MNHRSTRLALPLLVVLIIMLLAVPSNALANGGEWTWMSGADTAGQPGVYGTKGTPDLANVPGARWRSISWIDADDHLWLFGGYGLDSAGNLLAWLNDLWRYDVSDGLWTWMSGANTVNQAGVYGVKGTPAPTNVPGARAGSISWSDGVGDLWLFGGYGRDSAGNEDRLNDLWRYDVSAGRWTWMSGANTVNQAGVYGIKGTPAPTNVPGARSSSISWIDGVGDLWLFGGRGRDSAGSVGELNDLWRYDVSDGRWTWMSGANTVNQAGVYGVKGMPAPTNVPGARYDSISWIDANGQLWLFGGYGLDSAGNHWAWLNDLWRYDVSAGRWTWMSGANTVNQAGVHGTQGTAASTNMPGARALGISWVDADDQLWLFGGSGLDGVSGLGILNDLWRYDANGLWTWMSGANTVGQVGVYGTQGTSAPTNVPGAREVASNSWVDPDGHLWLFGGYGRDSAGNTGYLNDLWRYTNGTTLAVTLAAFSALQQNDTVRVNWETVSEVGNAGFNLYRSDSAAGPLALLNWLPSQAPGSTVGFAYSYEDRAVLPGQTLHYFLEDVSLSGATTLHGPVSVTIQTPTAVRLAGLETGSQVGIGWGWLLALAASGLALTGTLAGRRKGQVPLR